MAINLTEDYFKLFSLPADFDIDVDALGKTYRALQQEVHPDRFTASDASAQRAAVQRTAHLNEAYETLKDPLSRGFYLLGLKGVGVGTHEYTTSDGAFLMQQLERREALEQVQQTEEPFDVLEALRDVSHEDERKQMSVFREAWAAGDYDTAYDALTKVMFIRRMLQQIDEVEERVEDELD